VRENYLPYSPPDIQDFETESVTEVLRSKWITRGVKCTEFENALADYTGAKKAVVLSSATAGLFLLLKLRGIGEGDEVITTPYTFAATANVIIHTGALPVFADIEQDGFSISPMEIEKKITSKTRAIIPVHFAGHPVHLDEIKELARIHNLFVIEDAAHAIGAAYRGRQIGNSEHGAVFSFHAVKNLTTAEGGAITTNDVDLVKKLLLYSLHGQTKDAYEKTLAGGWEYDITVPGYKFNMTDIQAAMGIEQLKRLDNNRLKREAVAKMYSDFFRQFDFVKTPFVEKDITHAWHLYPLTIDFSKLTVNRNTFIHALAAENISSNVHFKPVHIMSYYAKTFGYSAYDFPNAYNTFCNEISLPLYPLLSKKDVSDVLEAFAKLLHYYKK
jgi:dTDP-4-amino-4,6-dideoxygalactose transaminase